MFERTLDNLVKGIRAHKSDVGTYVSNEIQRIKGELKSSDPFTKAEAVRKLTYLNMLGYSISWAAFSIVEVMSMPRFGHKRIGYLAASQSFRVNTEVILLTTNLLKKELTSRNDYEVGLAANFIANIATCDLSRDILSDVVALLQHQRPYVRKKALLVLYKLFEQYPHALRLCFDKIRERFEDTDKGVVSCAVSVLCELADRNPKNYLALAPQLFTILTTSSNNWMLIKVVKLFGLLVEEEPRLARKLLEPLSIIIQRTSAKSLLYECIHTVTLGLPYTKKPDGTDSRVVPSLVKLCSDHLRGFIQDPDQNLKYLGLVGFANLMNSHPRAVAEHYNLIIDCLEDDDTTIRTRSLDLLAGMVTVRTLEGLVQRLLKHISLSEGNYRQELIGKIMFMCSRDKYAFLSDFKWYMGVLLDLVTMIGPGLERLISHQLIDVALRVESIREFAVSSMIDILLCPDVISNKRIEDEPLSAMVWIVGEYAGLISNIVTRRKEKASSEDLSNSVWCGLFRTFLSPEITECTSYLQSTFISSAFKIFVSACSPSSGVSDKEISDMLSGLYLRLLQFCKSRYVEVSERSSNMLQLFISYCIVCEPEPPQPSHEREESLPPLLSSPMNDSSDEEDSVDKDKRYSSSSPVDLLMKEGQESSSEQPPLNLLDVDLLLVAHGGIQTVNDNNNNVLLPTKLNNEGEDEKEDGRDGGSRIEGSTLLALRLDDQGVTASRVAEGHLRALITVPLNPVNPKAQSKVPPPEGISLEDAINPELLTELLQDIDSTTNSTRDLSAVRFIQDEYYPQYEPTGGRMKGSGTSASYMDNKDGRMTLKGTTIDHHMDSDSGYAEVNGTMSCEGNTPQKRDETSSAFYLGCKEEVKIKDQDVPDTSRDKLPGECDELENDEAYAGGLLRRRSKKLDRKRSRKHSKKQQYRMNYSEAMPAGAEVSGDDEPAAHVMHHRRRHARRNESDELGKIDITTPLGEDERMPELKHRDIVQQQQEQHQNQEVVDEGSSRDAKEVVKVKRGSGHGSRSQKDKRKHSQKQKMTKDGISKSSKHQKGNGSGSTSNKQGDLLDFSGFSYPEVTSVGQQQMMKTLSCEPPLQVKSSPMADLSDLFGKAGLDAGELQSPAKLSGAVTSVSQEPVLQPDHNGGGEGKEIELGPSTSSTTKKKRKSRKGKDRSSSRKHSSKDRDIAAKKNVDEYLLL